jgi:hypothetical protein
MLWMPLTWYATNIRQKLTILLPVHFDFYELGYDVSLCCLSPSIRLVRDE